jgi:multiple sugar transport system substrate-binding protein
MYRWYSILRRTTMKQRNLLTLALLALVAAAPSVSAQAKTTLTVNCFTNLDEAVTANIPNYKKLHPEVEIKMNILGYGDHHSAIQTALATGSGAGDVACIEIGFVGRFMEGGGLTNLDDAPYNAKQYKDKMTAYAWAQAVALDGHNYSMPTDVASGTMFYRNDVLTRLGVKPSELTGSWDSYIAAGKKMHAKDPTVFLIGGADQVAQLYIRANIGEGEYLYFDKSGKTIVDSPRFVKAFELAKQIRDAKLDAKIGNWSAEWTDALNKGTIATQFFGAWFEGTMRGMVPKTAGLWRASDLPSKSFGSWGGSYYAIPKESKQKAAAWDFIKYLTTTKEAQLTSLKAISALPVLKAAQSLPELREPLPFLGGQVARATWVKNANKVKPIDVNKLDPVAEEEVAKALTSMLEEGKDIKTVLAEAKIAIDRRKK